MLLKYDEYFSTSDYVVKTSLNHAHLQNNSVGVDVLGFKVKKLNKDWFDHKINA